MHLASMAIVASKIKATSTRAAICTRNPGVARKEGSTCEDTTATELVAGFPDSMKLRIVQRFSEADDMVQDMRGVSKRSKEPVFVVARVANDV